MAVQVITSNDPADFAKKLEEFEQKNVVSEKHFSSSVVPLGMQQAIQGVQPQMQFGAVFVAILYYQAIGELAVAMTDTTGRK